MLQHYRIESANENEIGIVLSLEHLIRALKSAQDAIEIQIKLKIRTTWISLGLCVLRTMGTGGTSRRAIGV